MAIDRPTHVVLVFGGASAGSVAAETLAQAGCQVVVFEQNPRPYGKIEDGLPRWHGKQRRQEYERIDARLDRPGVTYVPCTKLGRDVDFQEVANTWGASAVILANGAWRDRPLEVTGAADFVGRGLVYQNPLIYWYNHQHEAGYDGERYELPERVVVVGGGLASIDVIKIVQIVHYAQVLERRGIRADLDEMEHQGLPAYLAAHGIADPHALGVTPVVLVYRRKVGDMPLSPTPPGATSEQLAKLAVVRQKILGKVQEKFLFTLAAETLPIGLATAGGRVVGLDVARTRSAGRGVERIPGSESTLPADLVISSIGSIPEPVPGIEMDGVYYRFGDAETGEYRPCRGVFGAGNVITGQGNIRVSVEHGKQIAQHVVERHLGIAADGARSLDGAGDAAAARGAALAEHVGKELAARAPLAADAADRILERARAHQRRVGYTGYREWIARVTPPDGV